ncbi:Predicted dehydrogenase [Carnobacterium iners]|uniref:Predicted dehydrogenase n=1 Tax=Carnobacterium iners TaxID=1073423 RepID=A0A1X7N814_9LACT|nr:Gfo/Idh/MocA family oxidoreductase [Carnobacterium iners]SEL22707.1 Predicted dehydrogenase [Carnobacterium iners]SMH33671.1 Predicted dehydrogenase [Carnobacterium iners]
MTLRLGIIGTNWITNQFIDGAIKTGLYTMTGVYSRTVEKAKAFGEPYGATVFETDLASYANHPDLDVVYIASPNSLHFEQAMALMKAGKHVIVEKPMFSNPREWEAAVKVANENKVFLFEAARHIHEENFKLVKDNIQKISHVQGASLMYMKYSSRYDQVLAGKEPNIFSLKFSGGALADLGVYPLYAALSWFGVPKSSQYFCTKLATGVDGKGTVILRYDTFDVTIQTGKIANSYLPSEIYGLDETLLLDGVSDIACIERVDRKTNLKETISQPITQAPMMEEAEAFAKVINNPTDKEALKDYADWQELSRQVNILLTSLRIDAGIVYEADQEK